MRCPHCNEKVGFYFEWWSPRRLKKGTCPHCDGKVTIAFNAKRFAIVLPLVILLVVALWHTLSQNMLAILSATVIFFGTVQLEKMPSV